MKNCSLILILSLLIVFVSCSDDEDDPGSVNPTISFNDGTILTGPDDCGFILSRPNSSLKPVNLPAAFQVAGLKVKGKYRTKSTNTICGLKNFSYPDISILEIENR